jgi:hypothetical protein
MANIARRNPRNDHEHHDGVTKPAHTRDPQWTASVEGGRLAIDGSWELRGISASRPSDWKSSARQQVCLCIHLPRNPAQPPVIELRVEVPSLVPELLVLHRFQSDVVEDAPDQELRVCEHSDFVHPVPPGHRQPLDERHEFAVATGPAPLQPAKIMTTTRVAITKRFIAPTPSAGRPSRAPPRTSPRRRSPTAARYRRGAG